ncbi:2-oxo acid dehydrogenase subunit E2 [Streptomyces sp. RLB3-17]|uniref:dihydrolipoamide acetyltransferase family protein n=1 Tax=unclassified Streptomyces TaxID=2593676 RepID=UPI001162E5C2|nr:MULTISPECIES: dihydrolipoamide acetyltransferase family protein [unclassified Streptomyces]NMI54323.1 2-oxo acid dehydrogenase subunit E2 [Streptomyces sp. RLA2-12]QDN63091.1 2-oxo acid dehydrogenase subunit E2 [Streptomyces sp. S1D4-20]QDN73143.1 2-oxo acid dehydrogenase subunit E2 [Streptomyces sp. S1D4-14]QDN93412.1 2-oxo acid dehydrogenase subunit E2 [Streptomyces sp. RLB3-6]QDO03852.1 2-oxo acid dehydrogenase subunit E2 [Streptomyces sp. RLB1-9]
MAKLLHMPEVAAGSTEALLSQWLVKEHTSFGAGDPIAVIETDKAMVELEAEHDATLAGILAEAGSTVEVGSPIAVLLDPGEDFTDLNAVLAQLAIAEPPSPNATAQAGITTSPLPEGLGAAPAATEEPQRIFASPLARRLLKQAGLSLTDVHGTGPHGRIVRKDVERAVAARADGGAAADNGFAAKTSAAELTNVSQTPPEAERPAPTPSAPASEAGRQAAAAQPGLAEIIPHTRLRRAVAARLTQSKQQAPHFYLKGSARLDALLALRSEVNQVSATRVSVNDFVIKAAAYAHQQVPPMNVVWQDEHMLSYASVDIGVAIASPRGLVTPVVRSVDSRPLGSVAHQVKEYVEQAGAGRLTQRDLEGGTLTITNLGMFGVEEFSAIINPPQAAILAVGAGRKEPAVSDDGTLTTATVMRVVLSVDHRAVDGADAARWMSEFTKAIEQPMLLLL